MRIKLIGQAYIRGAITLKRADGLDATISIRDLEGIVPRGNGFLDGRGLLFDAHPLPLGKDRRYIAIQEDRQHAFVHGGVVSGNLDRGKVRKHNRHVQSAAVFCRHNSV